MRRRHRHVGFVRLYRLDVVRVLSGNEAIECRLHLAVAAISIVKETDRPSADHLSGFLRR
jgi:hypothetical protein